MGVISGVQHQLPNAGLDFPSPPFQAFNQDLPIPNMTFVVPSASYSFGCRDLLVASSLLEVDNGISVFSVHE